MTQGYTNGRSERRRFTAVRHFIIFVCLIIGCMLLVSSLSDMVNALLAAALMTAIAAAIVLKQPQITNATTVFMAFFIIYQLVLPLAYVFGAVWVVGGEFLLSSWRLLQKGCIIASAGLLAYTAGQNIAGRSRHRSLWHVRELLPHSQARRLAPLFFVVAVLTWALLFGVAEMPMEALLGRSPAGRYRGLLHGIYGHGYIMNLTFAANIAIILVFIADPRRTVFSPTSLALFGLVFICNSFDGSRLLLIMTPLSALFARMLFVDRARKKQRTLWDRRRLQRSQTLTITLVVIVLLPIVVVYGFYRSGNEDDILKDGNTLGYMIANTFDTAATYFMVLERVPKEVDYWYGKSITAPLLTRIPSAIFPSKHEHLWAAQRFTLLFYGYDQYDPDTVSRGACLLAEAQINGGVLGVMCVMFLFGAFNEYLSKRVADHKNSNFFKCLYTIYVLYFIPYAFKSGVIAAISYIDVKLLLFVLPIFVFRRRLLSGTRSSLRPLSPVRLWASR